MKHIDTIGFILLLIGCSAMDSNGTGIYIAGITAVIGVVLMILGAERKTR